MAAPYRVGVIGRTGRGNYGHGLDQVWADIPRATVVAVADDNADGRALAVRRTGARRAYADYREMLDREQLDIVTVAPRWIDAHAEMVLAAVERGCHIYMEKPFCRTPAEADAIVNACDMRHVKLAIAHQTRWSPVLDLLQHELRQGLIGEILELRGRGKEDARRGGGEDLWVLGSHILDLMRLFAGDPATCFAQVRANDRPARPADVVDGAEGIGPLVGDSLNAMYSFSKDVTGYFSTHRGSASRQSRFGLQIFGSEGIVEIVTGSLEPVWVLRDSVWSPGRTGARWEKLASAGFGQPEPLEDQGLHGGNVMAVNDLLDCIENPDRSPRCDARDARWIIEMITAVFASHVSGGPVTFPLENRDNPLAGWQ